MPTAQATTKTKSVSAKKIPIGLPVFHWKRPNPYKGLSGWKGCGNRRRGEKGFEQGWSQISGQLAVNITANISMGDWASAAKIKPLPNGSIGSNDPKRWRKARLFWSPAETGRRILWSIKTRLSIPVAKCRHSGTSAMFGLLHPVRGQMPSILID